MTALATCGKYEIPYDLIEKAGIVGGYADEDDTKMAIDCFFDSFDYPLDTHTAVAVTVYNNYVAETGDETPTVVVATASPYKFPRTCTTQSLTRTATTRFRQYKNFIAYRA